MIGHNLISVVVTGTAKLAATTSKSASRLIKLLTIAKSQLVFTFVEKITSRIFRYCSSSKSSMNCSCNIKALTPSYLVNLGTVEL